MTVLELANGIGVKNGYNPYVDQSFWAVKQPNGALRFYYRSMLHQSYHQGYIGDRSFFGTVVSKTLYFYEYTTSLKNPMSNPMVKNAPGGRIMITAGSKPGTS